MKRRRPNPRLVKIHRNYTVEEVAVLLGVHKNTVREWIKQGLPVINDRRPIIILGRELRPYLEERRAKNKRTCKPGEIFCVKCRSPRTPAGLLADYQPLTASLGNLVGFCPICDCFIYRRVNRFKLAQVCGPLEVAMPEAQRHINESNHPSLNCDLKSEVSDREKA